MVPNGDVEIVIAEPLDRTWRLTTRDEGWIFIDHVDDAEAPSGAVVSMTAEQAWRLLTSNYDTETHRELRTSGDPTLIEVIVRTRAIIGAPKRR